MRAFSALLLVLAVLPARAQEAPEIALPDSIVVTAERLPAHIRDAGRRIEVYTARDIEALPVASVDELLRTVAGLEVQSRGGWGVQSDLTMRGSGFNGVVMLLDGARLNDPMTGHFLADLPVPLADIARVEVLRGPAVSLYGPDAVGGVVQLFTYAGLRARGMPARLEGEAEVLGGAHGLYDAGFALRGGERVYLSAAASWQGADGAPIEIDGERVEGPDGPVRTDFERSVLSAAATTALGNATLYARAGYDTRDFGAFHFYTPFASDTARESTTTRWLQARLAGDAAARTRWQVQASGRSHDDAYRYNPQVPEPNEHTSRLASVGAELSHALTPALRLSGGVDASVRDIDSNRMGQHGDEAVGAFVSGSWTAAPGLRLGFGGRLDYDAVYGLEPTPHLRAAYNRDALTLRAAAARSVRAPNYVERYLDAGGNVGNPDLDAERAWSAEAGADLRLPTGTALYATAFARRTDGLIDYARRGEEEAFRAQNILQVDVRGLELEATHRAWAGPARIDVGLAYTWLDADLGRTPDDVVFKYALTNARHLVQAHAAATVQGLTLSLRGLWKERMDDLEGALDARYGVVHARAAYRLDVAGTRLTLQSEVRNLLDARHAEVFDAPLPGRWWAFGVKVGR